MPSVTDTNRFDAWVRSVGSDPDPRFTLANERTFLAWMTTSLGLLGIGLAVGTIIPGEPVVLKVIAALWIVLSVLVAVRALVRWFVVERAMRRGEGLPLSRSIPVLALALGVLALASAGVIVVAP
jgi:putative membrane protein